MPSPVLTIDCVLPCALLTLEQTKTLDELQPFGNGNPSPVFAVLEAIINSITPLSGGKHSQIEFMIGNEKFAGLLFFIGPNSVGYLPGDKVDVAFTLSWGMYREQPKFTIKIVDIHPSGFDIDEVYSAKRIYECCRLGENSKHNALPSRGEVVDVYRFLKKYQPVDYEPDSIYIQMLREGAVDYVRMRIAIDALIELNLVLIEEAPTKKVLTINPLSTKNPLENSAILRSLSTSL
jgi:single-stranded-DNA-specific exonuclease